MPLAHFPELSNENQEGFITGGAGPLELHDGVVVDPRTQMPVGVVQPVPTHIS